ncbi:MAG: hypothetical protein HC804_11725 [Anaerolineae bacterium]|nr:hypothetical protein [Anaerolineae bacterium]
MTPLCNGIPGDLMTTVDIDPLGQASFACTAVVDSLLAVQIAKEVDQSEVEAGTAVTYTITLTNPNAITLTNVLVTDADVTGCSPALGDPITLPPAASQLYVCANQIISSTTVNTATVTADVTLLNVAAASAPEAPNSPVSTAAVPVTVNLMAQASTAVTVIVIRPRQITGSTCPLS